MSLTVEQKCFELGRCVKCLGFKVITEHCITCPVCNGTGKLQEKCKECEHVCDSKCIFDNRGGVR